MPLDPGHRLGQLVRASVSYPLAWILSTPRQKGFQRRSSTALSPATMHHAQRFLTLITRAGSAVTGRSG